MGFVLTSFLCLAAFPIALGAPAKLYARAVSEELLVRLNLFEQYSAAAYCPSNNNSTGTKVTCDAGNCPQVEAADTTTLDEFENSTFADTSGFVATDNTNQLIVVSFRGSSSVRNYVADLSFPLVPASDICTGCFVHVGFYNAWQEVKTSVTAAVESAIQANPTYKIVATGHSLGGAIATVAVADLRGRNNSVGLFTYGSPRVGNSIFAGYVSSQLGELYRVTHTDDPVPKLPPPGFADYKHVYGQYWITSGNDVPVTAADITVFEGDADLVGNQATLTSDTAAHSWYFNAVGACSPDGFEFRKRAPAELDIEGEY